MTAYHNWTHRSRSRGGTDPLEFGGHGPWIEPELVNGYVDTTVAPDTFAYRHAPGSPDDAWEIEFRGHIEGPSSTYAFVLPTEDLPLSDKYGITEGEDSDTGDGLAVEWYIEAATGFVFFTYPVGGAGLTAAEIAFTPAGTIAASDVQAAIEEVASEAGGGSGIAEAFRVHRASGSAQSLGTGFNDLTWPTEDLDTDGMFTATSANVAIQTAGWWEFQCFAYGVGAPANMFVEILVNGTTVGSDGPITSASGYDFRGNAAAFENCSVSDVVKARVYHDGAGSKNFYGVFWGKLLI